MAIDSLIKADIFFVIASVATVILVILLSTLLIYVIRTAKNLYALTETVKDGFKGSEEFIADLRDRLEDNMVFRLFFPPLKRRRKTAVREVNHKDNN